MTPDFEQKARELAPCGRMGRAGYVAFNCRAGQHDADCFASLQPAIAQALREMYEAGGAESIERKWLRENGWRVGVHNDYRLAGEDRTFWLFTHPSGLYVKGEGKTDAEAVHEAYNAARLGTDPINPTQGA